MSRMSKSWDDALRKAREKGRRVCKCGERFDLHGATPPHDRGEECPGFVETPRRPTPRSPR